MAVNRAQGFKPRDVSQENQGHDIESLYPHGHAKAGRLRFIEVKGRLAGAETTTMTKNEILTAVNKPDEFFLALVFIGAGGVQSPRYIERPFEQEPDFATASVNFKLAELLRLLEAPANERIPKSF